MTKTIEIPAGFELLGLQTTVKHYEHYDWRAEPIHLDTEHVAIMPARGGKWHLKSSLYGAGDQHIYSNEKFDSLADLKKRLRSFARNSKKHALAEQARYLRNVKEGEKHEAEMEAWVAEQYENISYMTVAEILLNRPAAYIDSLDRVEDWDGDRKDYTKAERADDLRWSQRSHLWERDAIVRKVGKSSSEYRANRDRYYIRAYAGGPLLTVAIKDTNDRKNYLYLDTKVPVVRELTRPRPVRVYDED